MITKTENRKLKIFLKDDYVEDVLIVLKEKGITNRNGNEHHGSMIRFVLNGKRKNWKIKSAIFQVYANREAEDLKIKEFLKPKKPEAVTPGN